MCLKYILNSMLLLIKVCLKLNGFDALICHAMCVQVYGMVAMAEGA